ncbi:hypothetical protein MRX96_034249, partial [Rhipicephalus microplus]
GTNSSTGFEREPSEHHYKQRWYRPIGVSTEGMDLRCGLSDQTRLLFPKWHQDRAKNLEEYPSVAGGAGDVLWPFCAAVCCLVAVTVSGVIVFYILFLCKSSFQFDYETKYAHASKSNRKPKSTNYDKYDPQSYTKPKSTNYNYAKHESNNYKYDPQSYAKPESNNYKYDPQSYAKPESNNYKYDPQSYAKPESNNYNDSFFCTTSLGLVPIAVPPDGVCDYVFFDSLYTNNDFKFIDSAPTGELLTFLTAAKDTRRTEYGCGINVRYTSDARSHLRMRPEDCTNFIQALISSNIIAFGILSINKNQFSDATVFGRAVSLLSELKAFLLNALGRDDLFTLIGIYISGMETKDAMTRTFNAVKAPDVIIGLGHIAYVTSNMTNCEMLPHSTYNNTKKSQQLRAKYGSLYDLYCKARVELPGLKFGVAAYDVNYDNGVSNSILCPAHKTKIGDFVRVQIMRKMRDGFRNQVFGDVDECITAIGPFLSSAPKISPKVAKHGGTNSSTGLSASQASTTTSSGGIDRSEIQPKEWTSTAGVRSDATIVPEVASGPGEEPGGVPVVDSALVAGGAGGMLWPFCAAICCLVAVTASGVIVFYILFSSGVDSDSFFCTTSLGLVPIAVPPDGVCDYVFFDSLYTNNDFKFIDSAPTGELLTFLTAAKDTRRTEYGCGINVRSRRRRASRFKSVVRSGNRSSLINPESEGGIGFTWADEVKGLAMMDKAPTTRGQSCDNERLAWADGA